MPRKKEKKVPGTGPTYRQNRHAAFFHCGFNPFHSSDLPDREKFADCVGGIHFPRMSEGAQDVGGWSPTEIALVVGDFVKEFASEKTPYEVTQAVHMAAQVVPRSAGMQALEANACARLIAISVLG